MPSVTYRSEKKTRTLVAVGLFAALAYVCCLLFHFRLSFLTFDLKDAVMAIGAMLFGPLYGLAMTFIVCLIEMFTASTTGLYGFVMNILASAAFVCIGSAIYVRRRTLSGAVIGMAASAVGMTAVMMAANLLITPYYMTSLSPESAVTAADVAKMIPPLLLPFNLTKAIFNAALVFLLYKPISTALRHAGFSSAANAPQAAPASGKGTRLAVPIIAAVIAAAALLYFFLVLSGSFSFA
ncbi:MAG: ECF transporter S component [Clostridiales bacterium]|nr:ECF transporter S component [Clostridiales bacterium]